MFHSSSIYTDPSFPHSSSDATSLPPPPFYDATTLSSSLPSTNYFIHRSNSTHSFPHYNPHPLPYPFSSSACDILDFHSEPTTVRRVFSTGDLLQASNENSTQESAAAAVGQVGRYSAEERMKRIEKYRNKRNQRNFHKKITYACRKTLADSRPRVRGRFARNGEPETEAELEAETEAEPEVSESTTTTTTTTTSYDSYNIHLHPNSCNIDENGGGNAGEWWHQMQAALLSTAAGGGGEYQDGCYDEDLWASFESVFSMNLLS